MVGQHLPEQRHQPAAGQAHHAGEGPRRGAIGQRLVRALRMKSAGLPFCGAMDGHRVDGSGSSAICTSAGPGKRAGTVLATMTSTRDTRSA